MSYYIVLCIGVLVAGSEAKNARIVGGTETSTAVHPHQAHLEADTFLGILWSAICGAAIIDNQWALTAAHCTEGYSNFRIVVNKGLSTQATVTVASVTQHEDYVGDYNPSYGAYPNDISLLRLSTNSVITSTNAIGLATLADGDFAGQTCTISGWGLTVGGGSASPVLLETNGEILSEAGCGALWNIDGEEPYKHGVHLCIHEPNSGACNGDSGGPMVCGGVLAGITSWGASGCDTNAPSVYTRVSTYYDWVQGKIGQAKKMAVPTLH